MSEPDAQQAAPVATPAPAPAAVPPRDLERRFALRVSPVSIALAVAFVLLAALWYTTNSELNRVRDDVARRVQQSDLELRESRVVAKEAQESARESQSRLGQLEGKVAESQSQQVALEQLYHELSRGRDEWLLAEIEQTLALASQQLQLAGNVQGALIALQVADARLARSDRPQLIPLRKVINRDIDRLKALPNVDIAGVTLKLDEVIGGVDQLTLLADGKPQLEPDEPRAEESLWRRMSALVWGEIKLLVRIQRLDNADQGLLAPEQSYFLRENLKLRLMHARLALMQRNDEMFRSDIKRAREWMAKYFDMRQKRVSAAQATLEQLNATTLSIELPTLADSLTALRNLKISAEKPS
jgi:uncharacterized protein HemX